MLLIEFCRQEIFYVLNEDAYLIDILTYTHTNTPTDTHTHTQTHLQTHIQNVRMRILFLWDEIHAHTLEYWNKLVTTTTSTRLLNHLEILIVAIIDPRQTSIKNTLDIANTSYALSLLAVIFVVSSVLLFRLCLV